MFDAVFCSAFLLRRPSVCFSSELGTASDVTRLHEDVSLVWIISQICEIITRDL